jgi:hypothetical protein
MRNILQQQEIWGCSAASTYIAIFFNIKPCSLVELYKHFGGIYYLLLHDVNVMSVMIYQTTLHKKPTQSRSIKVVTSRLYLQYRILM